MRRLLTLPSARRKPLNPSGPLLTDTVIPVTVPAPIGGWNARDALDEMKNTDAITLINWYPRETYVEIRGGFQDQLTALPSLPKTLMHWNSPTGTGNKLWVAVSTGIYDATSAGAAGAAAVACTDAAFQYVNFATASGVEYLIAVNGVDNALYYDGTTWQSVTGVSAPIAITGPNTNTFIHVNIHKQRLFFVPKNKLSFFYLPVAQVGGVATEFMLNSVFPRGGYLVAMATWTIDAGTGLDDLAVFITSEGEVAVFSGSNPGDPTDWFLIGVYHIGRPLGRRCFCKLAGDVAILVESGVYPLSKALLSAILDAKAALSNKIVQAYTSAARIYFSNFGWQVMLYPAQNALIVNVPVADSTTSEQYVMNINSPYKPWCRFQGWNAENFIVFQGELYFCTGTGGNRVVKAWTTQNDASAIITADAKTAFTDFGSDRMKQVQQIRPILMVSGVLSFLLGINVDFEDIPPIGTASYNPPPSSLWDVALWDQGLWGADFVIQRDWRTSSANVGRKIAFLLRISTSAVVVQWPSTEFLIQPGAVQ